MTVSKAQYGLNVPLKTAHYLFYPNLVERLGIVILSGDKVPIIDSTTTYFGLFPYKKRYVKRMIGKPGDTLYFYGGKIYAIDKDGNELKEFLDAPWLKGLEHIPFISFAGHPIASKNQIVFTYAYQPLARTVISRFVEPRGEIFNGKEWIADDPKAAKSPHTSIKTLGDYWGIGNFAMSELLTKEELAKEGLDSKGLESGALYLLLRHNPSMQDLTNPFPSLEKSVIPLHPEHLKKIMDNMYTARFVVTDGKAKRYNFEDSSAPAKVCVFQTCPMELTNFISEKPTKFFGEVLRESYLQIMPYMISKMCRALPSRY